MDYFDREMEKLEKNNYFMQIAKTIAEDLKHRNGVIPTNMELYNNPNVNLDFLEMLIGINDDATVCELLIREAKKMNSPKKNSAKLARKTDKAVPLLREKYARIELEAIKQERKLRKAARV